jgi:antitoxin component YwqK of YwqJK toxin-antitoxin module
MAGTGKIINYYRSGKVKFERSYKDGKQDGIEKAWSESGTPEYEISYKNGLRDGKYISFSFSGAKWKEGNFSAGTGKITVYSGKIYGEEYYNEDKKDGAWRSYYSDGKTYYSADFSKGAGMYKYFYMNGSVMEEGGLYDEKQAGKWRMYYKSGAVKASATFSEGSGEGPVIMFYPNGTKMFEGFYNGESFEGESTWYYPSGRVKYKGAVSGDGLLDASIADEKEKKGLLVPYINKNALEFFYVTSLNEYVSMIKENKTLLTPDVREELRQLCKIMQEPLSDYKDLNAMYDSMSAAMVISMINDFIKAVDELTGTEGEAN